MSQGFDADIHLDQNNVIIYALKGPFDISEWAAAHRRFARTCPGGKLYPDYPVLSDVRELVPPSGNWIPLAREVFQHMETFGATNVRTAIVVGDNATMRIAAIFFVKCRDLLRVKGGEYAIFSDTVPAYAWLRG